MIDTFNDKYNYFYDEGKKMGMISVWSIYEIDNLDDNHPYKELKVKYNNDIEITGTTWRDLWVTANKLIRLSRNEDHIFIEAFETTNSDYLELITGS